MILGAWLSVILRKSSIFWRSDLCQQPSLRAFNTSPRTSSIIDCTKGDRTGGVGTAACGDIFSGVASPLAGHTVKDCLLMSARITSQECNKNSSASKQTRIYRAFGAAGIWKLGFSSSILCSKSWHTVTRIALMESRVKGHTLVSHGNSDGCNTENKQPFIHHFNHYSAQHILCSCQQNWKDMSSPFIFLGTFQHVHQLGFTGQAMPLSCALGVPGCDLSGNMSAMLKATPASTSLLPNQFDNSLAKRSQDQCYQRSWKTRNQWHRQW